MKKIILIALVIFVGLVIFNMKLDKQAQNPNDQTPIFAVMGPNKDDLVEFSIEPGSVVSGEMIVTGTVKNAYFFEANILISLLDANQNVLKRGFGTATTDWMTTGPVSFTANIDATDLTGAGYIEIRNDDPSDGEAGPAKIILIPVVFN